MAPDLEESFDTFVRTRGGHFLRVAVLLTGSVPEAEDLLQTSLIQLYRAWPRLGGTESAPDAYLRAILVNTRRSWWRTKWRRELPVGAVRERPDPVADLAEAHAFGALVRAALAELPRQQRAVLVLRYLEDLPVASVADLLGITAGTVKSQAHRGLRALRASLSPQDPVVADESAGSNGAKG